jgi:hypothetical protein
MKLQNGFLGALFLVALGCGSTKEEGGGTAIWPADAQHLRATSGGGYQGTPPAGSECQLNQSEIDVDVTSRTLTWKICQYAEVYVWDEGSRSLSPDEMGQLDAAMSGLVVSEREDCGADKGSLALRVDSPDGSVDYRDSFYACHQKPGVVYVDNIDAVFDTLEQLAQ